MNCQTNRPSGSTQLMLNPLTGVVECLTSSTYRLACSVSPRSTAWRNIFSSCVSPNPPPPPPLFLPLSSVSTPAAAADIRRDSLSMRYIRSIFHCPVYVHANSSPPTTRQVVAPRQQTVTTLTASIGKRNVTVWCPSVRLSNLFLTLIGRAAHILNVTHRGGAAYDAASVHFGRP